MSSEVVKRYTRDGITIVWRPAQCIHSTLCFRGLPGVFDPGRRPWVDLSAASIEAIVQQVATCPSGALSVERVAPAEEEARLQAELVRNGPLLLRGRLTLRGWDGSRSELEGVTAFCRCGASGRKPFCDGLHHTCGFEG